jgi:formylmethanofuran dehydrogenase subunit A
LNGSCLDPLHGIQFESKDLIIEAGKFCSPGDGRGMQGVSLDPVASARALVQTGFTTIAVDGISPFTALDVHQQLQRLPIVNKITVLDVANFQLLTGFLKSGAVNYAAAVACSLLARFKGYGLSCIGPGSTLTWSGAHPVKSRSIREPLPFLNTSIEKILTDLSTIHDQATFKPGIILQTGIEGMPGSREQLDNLLAKISGERKPGETAPRVAIKHLARFALDPRHKGGDIAENVAATVVAMEGAGSVAGLLDIPVPSFSDTTFIDEAASPLHDARHMPVRGIVEGELFVTAYQIREKEQQDLATRFWLAGMKLALDMPAALTGRVAFSLMPQLISGPANLASSMACLLSERYRLSRKQRFIDATAQSLAGELLEGKALSLQDLIRFTRVAPAVIFGLEKVLGGLGDGQLGDAIILNARHGDLDRLRDEPDELHNLLCNPHAVIKSGRVVFKNDKMDAQSRGLTILHEARVDASIADSIEQNIDKQFVKYYSTHIDAKTVPASFIEPSIND